MTYSRPHSQEVAKIGFGFVVRSVDDNRAAYSENIEKRGSLWLHL